MAIMMNKRTARIRPGIIDHFLCCRPTPPRSLVDSSVWLGALLHVKPPALPISDYWSQIQVGPGTNFRGLSPPIAFPTQ